MNLDKDYVLKKNNLIAKQYSKAREIMKKKFNISNIQIMRLMRGDDTKQRDYTTFDFYTRICSIVYDVEIVDTRVFIKGTNDVMIRYMRDPDCFEYSVYPLELFNLDGEDEIFNQIFTMMNMRVTHYIRDRITILRERVNLLISEASSTMKELNDLSEALLKEDE